MYVYIIYICTYVFVYLYVLVYICVYVSLFFRYHVRRNKINNMWEIWSLSPLGHCLQPRLKPESCNNCRRWFIYW